MYVKAVNFFRWGPDYSVITKTLHSQILIQLVCQLPVMAIMLTSNFMPLPLSILWNIRSEKVCQGSIHLLHCLLQQTSATNLFTKLVKHSDIYRKAWLRVLFVHSFLLQKLINVTYNDVEINHTFEHAWRQFLITVRSNRRFLLFALSHYLPLALHNCVVPIMFWQRCLTFNQGLMLAFNQLIVISCITELNFYFLLFFSLSITFHFRPISEQVKYNYMQTSLYFLYFRIIKKQMK